MIRLNQLFIASGLSLMIHSFFIYQFEESKKVEEIYVVDLSSHKEFKPKEIPKKKTKKVNNQLNKKTLKKEEIKKEKDVIPIKKKEIKKEIKEIETKNQINPEKPKIIEKKKVKKIEKVESNERNKFSLGQKKSTANNNAKKLLIDQKIKSFLIQISEEINKIAMRSYPIQSIKRREQGTIIAVIVLNANGNLLGISFENRRPRRLHEKTKEIIKNYKFPKPPSLIFETKETLKIKIPVNFILR